LHTIARESPIFAIIRVEPTINISTHVEPLNLQSILLFSIKI